MYQILPKNITRNNKNYEWLFWSCFYPDFTSKGFQHQNQNWISFSILVHQGVIFKVNFLNWRTFTKLNWNGSICLHVLPGCSFFQVLSFLFLSIWDCSNFRALIFDMDSALKYTLLKYLIGLVTPYGRRN